MANFVVSCRKNITSTIEFVSDKDFGIDHLSMENSKVLILVHGFSNQFDAATEAYQLISSKVKGYDHCIHFFWPSSWSKAVGFALAERRTKRASQFLAKVFSRLKSGKNDITVQGHSLGCRVVLEMTKEFDRRETSRFILTAPAVDADYFVKNNIDPHILFEVLTTKNDSVLKVTYRLMPYNWFSPAMGYAGPIMDKENVVWIKLDDVESHSDFRNKESFYKILNYT